MRADDENPDFLQFSFTDKELMDLQNKKHEGKKRSCFELTTDIFESAMAYVFKIGVFLAIILVNLMIVERFSLADNLKLLIEDGVF